MTSSHAAPDYPPSIAQLIAQLIDPRNGAVQRSGELESFDFMTAVAPSLVVDDEMALACTSGLWLRHHFLDRSHEISQHLHSSTGSFWHGIMHRLEGDFGNAKYWFRKVGDHPIFPSLASAAHTISPERFQATDVWDPYDFIDCCEKAAKKNMPDSTLLDVASAEWELLFAYCFQQALGIE
jgi:hypothetical protein